MQYNTHKSTQTFSAGFRVLTKRVVLYIIWWAGTYEIIRYGRYRNGVDSLLRSSVPDGGDSLIRILDGYFNTGNVVDFRPKY